MFKDYLDEVAKGFVSVINKSKDVSEIPTENFGWSNWRFRSKHFRMAHVERYSANKLEVLHVTTFPHKWSPEPIFGFDVITTDSKPVGCYMDFTPVMRHYDVDYGDGWTTGKDLPEWATVFSEKFLIVTPKDKEELYKFCEMGMGLYSGYLMNTLYAEHKDDVNKIVEIQNNYCHVQAQNPRTLTVLKNKIGQEKAEYFMNEILFPKIK
jgi:hypothetical protein